MKYSGKATLPPQQLLCETVSWKVDIEMKHLIIWSHPLANVPVEFFHPVIYFQILQMKLLTGFVRNQSGFTIYEKNIPHFVKVINPLNSDNKKEK